jgi:hypothetical protein
MVQGARDLLGTKYDNKGMGTRVLEAGMKLPQQFVPTVLKQARQLTDKYDRETYDPSFVKRTLVNPIVNKIPILSKKLPIKQTAEGKDVELYQGNNNAFNVLFNPSKTTEFKPNKIQKEILRLYDEGGQKTQVPTLVDRVIDKTQDHPRIELTPKEITQYQKRTGELTTSAFGQLMELNSYKQATSDAIKTADEKRADALATLIENSKKIAKAEILKQRGLPKK